MVECFQRITPGNNSHLLCHRKAQHSSRSVQPPTILPEDRERDLDEPDPRAESITADDIEAIGASRYAFRVTTSGRARLRELGRPEVLGGSDQACMV
jgi:hypothetical protein